MGDYVCYYARVRDLPILSLPPATGHLLFSLTMPKKSTLTFLLLALVGSACDPPTGPPTAPIPESSPSAANDAPSPQGNLTINPNAALTAYSPLEIHAVRVARRLKTDYGTSWKDIVATLRQVGQLSGRPHLQDIAGIIENDARITKLLSEIPDLSDSEKAARDELRAAGWEILRDRIAQDGTAPVPSAYEDIARGRTADERGRDTLRALNRLVEMYTETLEGESTSSPTTNPPSNESPSASGSAQYDPQCLLGCRQDAQDLLAILYEDCYDDYDDCCAIHGPCYAGSPGRERCLNEWYDCIDDARDQYRRWFAWCIRWCRF